VALLSAGGMGRVCFERKTQVVEIGFERLAP